MIFKVEVLYTTVNHGEFRKVWRQMHKVHQTRIDAELSRIEFKLRGFPARVLQYDKDTVR